MRKFLFFITFSLVLIIPVTSHGLLNKVKNSVSRELSDNSGGSASQRSSKPAPEPACACSDAVLIMDLSKFKIDYKEISISMKDDGSMLVKDRVSGKYYIAKNGTTEGPYSIGDPKIKGFDIVSSEDSDDDQKADAWLKKYPDFISKSGGKYTIKAGGKSFGPFAQINDFAVTRSKDRFAAVVVENQMISEDQGKEMEAAMKNAKTDQEKMAIAMKLQQQMMQQMSQGGGPQSIQPKLVSNIPGAGYDPAMLMGGSLNSSAKYDDIVVMTSTGIFDLKGNSLLKISPETASSEKLFVNTSGTKYAWYNYGTLTFSDNKSLSELFNPFLLKTEGKVFLTYMYYSPSRNSIMQCRVPF